MLKKTTLLAILALGTLFADVCMQTDEGIICCRDGSHPEQQAKWDCLTAPDGTFWCFQVTTCVDDEPTVPE